jgi:putative chitinase
VESLNYSAAALTSQWPLHFTSADAQRLGRTATHPADQKGIAELAYGGRMGNGKPGTGDGWLFRGRGLMQLTGRDGYTTFARKIGVPLTDLPALLETKKGAADSAAAFWKIDGCSVHANAGDIDTCRRIVNGGLIGIDDTRIRYAAAKAALGI